jgi:transcription antitermination factor NusG
MPILTIPGVLYVVGIGKEPVSVATDEIESVRAMTAAGMPLIAVPFLETGRRIRMVAGPLRGVEGILLSQAVPERLVVSVTLLRRSVAVQIQRAWVEPAEAAAALNRVG